MLKNYFYLVKRIEELERKVEELSVDVRLIDQNSTSRLDSVEKEVFKNDR